MSGTKRNELDAEKKNGVYLLGISKQFEGYTVDGGNGEVGVKNVKIHGNHLGCKDYMETECADFEFTDEGTLNLYYVDTGMDRS